MTACKKRLSYTVTFQSAYQPEELWEVLVDPTYAEDLAEEPCFGIVIPEDFALEVGKSYLELHTGEACQGDVCRYEILACEPGRLFQTRKHQAGLVETRTVTVTPTAQGSLIEETHHYGISRENFRWFHVLHWGLLHLGLVTKVMDVTEDERWFERMEELVCSRR